MKIITVPDAIDKLKPENIVLISSYDRANSRPSGMVAAWNTICSSSPHMVAIVLWKQGYTHKLIRDTGEFMLSVPNLKLLQAVEIFGQYHGNLVDKYNLANLNTSSAKYVHIPLLNDATLNFECKLEKEIDSGDYLLFVGRVLTAHTNGYPGVLLSFGRVNGQRVFREV